MPNPVSSDPSPAETRSRPRLIVLDGMPGAGKTTALEHLAATYPVVGEYLTAQGHTLAVQHHPGVDADDAHQRNWLHKSQIITQKLATGATVLADRDWLSSLAYAYSTYGQGRRAFLEQRCAWALHQLTTGGLRSPDRYLLLHIEPEASLRRRRARLRAHHPWSRRDGLARLADFYTDPATALAPYSPPLARHLSTVPTTRIDAQRPPTQVAADLRAAVEETL